MCQKMGCREEEEEEQEKEGVGGVGALVGRQRGASVPIRLEVIGISK